MAEGIIKRGEKKDKVLKVGLKVRGGLSDVRLNIISRTEMLGRSGFDETPNLVLFKSSSLKGKCR